MKLLTFANGIPIYSVSFVPFHKHFDCSLGGMFLMFTGLYLVLWAKGEEGLPNGNSLESEFDIERPLLC